MKLTRTALRWTAASALALPLALAGCGGTGGAPEPPVASTTASAVPGPVTPADGMPAQAAATDGRVALEQSAAAASDGVRQVSAEVAQKSFDAKYDVTRAVGEGQAQAQQAASNAAAGVKGFASDLKADAQQSYNDAVGEARGEVQATVAGVKAKARNQVKAAADTARKQAADLGDKVLDDVFGADAKAGKPN